MVQSSRNYMVCNTCGMHFRPIMRIIDIISKHSASVTFEFGNKSADGKSPIEMLMLCAPKGSLIKCTAVGPDAENVLQELQLEFDRGFDENC